MNVSNITCFPERIWVRLKNGNSVFLLIEENNNFKKCAQEKCENESGCVITCTCGGAEIVCSPCFNYFEDKEFCCKTCSSGGAHVKPCKDE